jgi:predicted glycoside hydrolase/deacetylase ChbG (UPF0249 family)
MPERDDRSPIGLKVSRPAPPANASGAPSLAERLGYGPDDRLLIVNCDDLGSSHAANAAALRTMTEGVATSATLMVPCPWAREAARMLKSLPVGVHFTLTSEYRSYRWRALTGGASLHDKEGFMHATSRAALDYVDPGEARAECRAQIERALSWGIDVTHLDAHMYVMQQRSDLYDIYLGLAAEYRLPVRMLPSETTQSQGFHARERAAARGVLFNEDMIEPWPRRTRDVLFEEIPRLRPGVSEVFAHPADDGEELRAYDHFHAEIRIHDAACLVDPSVAALLDRHNVKRISYRPIRDLQRAG